MTGFYGSSNICDFTLFKYPNFYYLESKATYEDRFDFAMLSETQYEEMYKKAQIEGVYACVIVLFATYKRAFIIDIREIHRVRDQGTKSLNIKKIDKWPLVYREVKTIPSRKDLLDYDTVENVL